jgi:spermidine/putrescine transport system substrate-binding protein
MKILRYFFLLLFPCITLAAPEVLNVYNWSAYIPESVIEEFTAQTGIQVRYMTFASNEELYAKISASNNHSGYDIIVPTVDFVQRMQTQGYLEKIDVSKIPNIKNLDKRFLGSTFIGGAQYGIPYLWGSTGLVINRLYLPHFKLTSFQDLWSPALRNQILMLDDPRTAFAIALKVLKKNPNTRDPKDIYQAYLLLKALLPNIKLFNIVAPQMIYANDDAAIGIGYNGDTFLAMQNNPNLVYIYPIEGPLMWVDSMAIPKNAPHLENAYRFINFILSPKIAAQIAQIIGYSTPNEAGYKLLPLDIQHNPVLYPPKAALAKGTFEEDVEKANTTYQYYWQLLKLNG